MLSDIVLAVDGEWRLTDERLHTDWYKANDAKHFALYYDGCSDRCSDRCCDHLFTAQLVGSGLLDNQLFAYHQKNESKMISNAYLIRHKLHINGDCLTVSRNAFPSYIK